MKTKSLLNALNKHLKGTCSNGVYTYTVGRKSVEVKDQNGNAVALPIIDHNVVHIGNYTIKNLIEFLTGLDSEKLDYLKTVKSMYSTSTNEYLVNLASNYEGI